MSDEISIGVKIIIIIIMVNVSYWMLKGEITSFSNIFCFYQTRMGKVLNYFIENPLVNCPEKCQCLSNGSIDRSTPEEYHWNRYILFQLIQNCFIKVCQLIKTSVTYLQLQSNTII